MTTGNNLISSEEIIFYIDLTTENLTKEVLIEEIRSFIQKKTKYSDSTFGIVIFQEDDNPISFYNENDPKSITKVIENYWDLRPKNQSYFENGLFLILSYIFSENRLKRKICRIIVISDTPSKHSEEYHQAVYDLIVKSKNFSTIIDIIRIGESEYYEDDIKLKVISSETHGGTFYCHNKQFNDILSSLIKSKQEFNIIQGEEGGQILEQDKTFYEQLATELITLDPEDEEICSICELELCPICGAYSDEIHKCYNCNAKYHGCCASRYSLIKNIGFKHIFRCPQCESLLKLDEDYVNLIYEEEFEELQKIVQKQDIELVSQEEQDLEEVYEPEQYIEEEDQQEIIIEEISIEPQNLPLPPSLPSILKIEPPPSPPPPKKIRIGGFFGQEVEVDSINKTKEIKIISSRETLVIKENLSITALRPPRKRISLKFCKICGSSVKNVIKCPNCGATID